MMAATGHYAPPCDACRDMVPAVMSATYPRGGELVTTHACMAHARVRIAAWQDAGAVFTGVSA